MVCSLVTVLKKLLRNGWIKQDYAVRLIVAQFQYHKSERVKCNSKAIFIVVNMNIKVTYDNYFIGFKYQS